MIDGKSVLAIIPARGGSKGVPGKNIREVASKPLIAWTIEEARKSLYLDRTIVSTDDLRIADTARQWGGEVPFLRPAQLALDSTPGIDPVLHALDALEEKYDLVVLLQPTSPLRTATDIDGCLEQLIASGSRSCVSVTVPDKSPYWMYQMDEGQRLSPLIEGCFTRRQDIPKVYALNGAVYSADSVWLQSSRSFFYEHTVGYIMTRERSLDIDTELDLRICSVILSAPGSVG